MASDVPTHARGSARALSWAQRVRVMDGSSIRVLPGTQRKHFAHVLCLGSYGGVVEGKLNRLHSDCGNITYQLCNLGK